MAEEKLIGVIAYTSGRRLTVAVSTKNEILFDVSQPGASFKVVMRKDQAERLGKLFSRAAKATWKLPSRQPRKAKGTGR